MQKQTGTANEVQCAASILRGAVRVDERLGHAIGGRYATGLQEDAVRQVSRSLTMLLADAFALFVKTKNFHWHMSGSSFRDHSAMLDDQSKEVLAMTDELASRVRKVGGTTLRSVSHVGRLQRVIDSDSHLEMPRDMLAELLNDNEQLASHLRAAHSLCRDVVDVASARTVEDLIDQTERRIWFLFEVSKVCTRAS